MGASFRNVSIPSHSTSFPQTNSHIHFQIGEIKALAGVDFLTIAPALLEKLKNDASPVPKKLDAIAGTSNYSHPSPGSSFTFSH